jgi:hypothetical protein
VDGDRPGSMSTLALFWPQPRPAELGDPLVAAGQRPDAMLGLTEVERDVRLAVATEAESELRLARRGSTVRLGAALVVDLLWWSSG